MHWLIMNKKGADYSLIIEYFLQKEFPLWTNVLEEYEHQVKLACHFTDQCISLLNTL